MPTSFGAASTPPRTLAFWGVCAEIRRYALSSLSMDTPEKPAVCQTDSGLCTSMGWSAPAVVRR